MRVLPGRATSRAPKKLRRRRPASAQPDAPRFFGTAAQFRAWLTLHAETATVLNVGFYKVGSGLPSITWHESVDEALCYGWIDGVRRRIDDNAYEIRFSPRKKGSVWSAINIARAQELIASGRMQRRGLAAYEQRTERRSRIYSYEQPHAPELTEQERRRFMRDKRAWSWFERQAPSRRRAVLHWITSARQPATRARRLEKLIESAAAGVRLMP
jgi:uncharacterized protein YdeI (YjbR/CyaY-like superfamily)